jgi:hypothetical protein
MKLEEFSNLNIFPGDSIGRTKTSFFAGFEYLMLVRWDKHHCEGILQLTLVTLLDKGTKISFVIECFIAHNEGWFSGCGMECIFPSIMMMF